MKYKAVVANAEQLGELSNFIQRQLMNHFQSWTSEVGFAVYSVAWVKESLVFITDSAYLFHKWMTIEKNYVNHLLGESCFPVADSAVSRHQNAA